MLKLDFVSARGDILPLSNHSLFALSHIDGQTAASASLSSAVIGGVDGDKVNSAQADPRIIVIDLTIRGGVEVETAKREILKYVKLKQRGGLVWEQKDRTVSIYGIVESIEMPRWENGFIVMQITLHCEQPFWEDVDEVVQQINEAISLHYFTDEPTGMLYFTEEGQPFGEYDTIRAKSFFNAGDVSIGLEITLYAHDTVTNPIIYDQNANFFGLGYDGNPFVMQAGDYVIITTHKGAKIASYNGVNVFDKIKPQSTWLQFETGDNGFSIDSDDENKSNMSFSIAYKQRYI